MLKGTEKQIKYAEDIKAEVISLLNKAAEIAPSVLKPEFVERNLIVLESAKNKINSIESAATIINDYQDVFIPSCECIGFKDYQNFLKFDFLCKKFKSSEATVPMVFVKVRNSFR